MDNQTPNEATPAVAAGGFNKPMLKRWFYLFILFIWCPLLALATASEVLRPAALDGFGTGGGWVLFWVWLGTVVVFVVVRRYDFHRKPARINRTPVR